MKKDKKSPMAAAIQYDSEKDAAPRMTAKGRGLIAERIIEIARQHDIPVRSDPALVEVLCKLDMEEEIPETLYRVVAEILAFVYRMNERRKEQQSTG
jgi:flagellar biosynthesis protein